MSIRIFSKKSFAIGPGAQRGNPEIESFQTVPGSFQDMPEKYATDPTYLLAVKAGDITVISGANQKVVENDEPKAEVDDGAVQTAVEAFYEELKGMSRDEAAEIAEKYNVAAEDGEKLSSFKKRILEAYKLAAGE